MEEKLFCPPGISQNVPLRVRLMRAQFTKKDYEYNRGLEIPRDIERFCDLSYGPYEGWNLLDVYRSREKAGKTLPVIVSVHGGGFFYGNRELYQFYCMNLAQRGFAVINFDYRLAPEYRYPAPVEDTNMVFAWVYAHAEEYGLDTDNVFLLGDSAGGQIASQYALVWSNPAYAALLGLEVPPVQLRAVGLNCGLYDMGGDAVYQNHEHDHIMEDYFGVADPRPREDLEIFKYINSDYPPTHLMSSWRDHQLPNCVPMAEHLKSRGVDVAYKIYGAPEDNTVRHVFHMRMRLPEGKQGNTDQMAFFRAHMVK